MALRKHDWGEWSNITLDDIEQAGVTEGVEQSREGLRHPQGECDHEGCRHEGCHHEGHVHEDIVQDEYNREFFEKFPQFMEAVNDGRIECEVTSDGFIIFYDWKNVEYAQKLLDPEFDNKDEYDQSVFDEYDVEWGFSDEYSSCSECYKVIRTSPDSYSWKADFYVGEYELLCHDCVMKDKESYIQWILEAPTDRANTILSPQDLEEIGFEKVEGDYESGWYGRQDNPSEILAKAQEEYPYAEFVFNITEKGQWSTNFDLWGRGMDYVDEEEEEDEGAEGE